MTHALALVGWNALVALLMAALVWLACRTPPLRRRPALGHALWLLVLVKLVTPPLVPLPMLPALSAEPAALAGAPNLLEITTHPSDRPPSLVDSTASQTPSANTAAPAHVDRSASAAPWRNAVLGLLAASLCVTVALWLAAMRQFRRVHRLFAVHAVQSGRAARLLHELAPQFALRSVPRLLIVDAPLAPMLWAAPDKPTIVLPQALLDTFDDEQLRSVLAHELAHCVRRDHWSNLLAFLVATLCWWNPLAWFARREMAAAAEACCDTLALERVAGSRKTYAGTLLQVVDFVSVIELPRPALGVCFARRHALRQRFELLADTHVASGMSRAGWLLLALGFASLWLVPARAQETPDPAIAAKAQPLAEAGKFYVTGVVTDGDTKQPIAGANVRFMIDSEQDPAKRGLSTVTGPDGRYRVEVPLGDFRLWFPRLVPGYWVDHTEATANLTTSREKPIVTRDIVARRAPIWPFRVIVPGGIPESDMNVATVNEVEDDEKRRDWLAGRPVSFMTHIESAHFLFGNDGRGSFTQCGTTGKLLVGLGGYAFDGAMTELIVQKDFDNAKIKSITPADDAGLVTMTDDQGRTATILNTDVALENGLPLFTFRLNRLPEQKFNGRVVDLGGKPLAGVRVGTTLGASGGGTGDTGYSANSNEDGRFNLVMPVRVQKHPLEMRLVITKDGYAGFDSDPFDFPAKATDPIDVGQFELQPGHMLKVRIVDPSNKPLSGATVEPHGSYAHRRQAARTDAEGRATLHNLSPGRVNVSARYGSLTRAVDLIIDEVPNILPTEMTIQLEELPKEKP